ncbi:pyruvate, phosphate dikinase [Alicyclobacillus cycloheptanicus]|uniref:Pyruvate, phosphate dikinase n=1 Tax=Alicyclobacillus cycloheptanicus TaxID=1457 RepID=A0ABT9XJJ0_9BACL|nr:pyruvate, phosphate dikinase [Alicyclobacillus cycloheptanicus]MDQ0190467.1 pyruvate,orthophosphate dikinase [Alicyclobacillus cycloheptanicus]WDM00769.1 pyruvate, phosphate dikinase [Alicyclobacillus cycloheptanicus]
MSQWVYPFETGRAADKMLLGGKGANLAEMTRAGLPVPPGFTIGTPACHAFYEQGGALSAEMWSEIETAVHHLEEAAGKQFGGADNPLLVSVRSGAPISMPGMMDTVLNLGLNDETVQGLARRTQNERFAYDCYRRFIQMFGDVVLGLPHYQFEQVLDDVKDSVGVKDDQQMRAEDWQKLIARFRKLVERETGRPFPQNPYEQLRMAIEAVFRSWNNQRAIVYRKIHKISDELGTAVNVQSMVFGNMGEDSGTGVAFTRNPSTGEPGVFGEYLTNAQGEDVVAGIRTPKPIAQLADEMPAIYNQFLQVCDQLERHYKDVQDIEFTVEQGRLYLLQTRSAKRTAEAAVRIAVALVNEGLIDQKTALTRVDPDQIDQLLHPRIDPDHEVDVLATGLPASPGAASGKIVLSADDAEARAKAGEKVLLVRTETTPEDIHGILAAEGILTSRGGMTSHAAVVARGMGKPCVCGCDALQINMRTKTVQIGSHTFREGDVISIDGATGRVLRGEVAHVRPELSEDFRTLLGWADEVRRLEVRANADNPEDAEKARAFGAQGIGLCRTEHMFMAPERVPVVQSMILAKTLEERNAALARLLPMQQGDFYGILKAMDGLPVTIRLLDPPLHEFLPNLEQLVAHQAALQTKLQYVSGLEAEQTQQELEDVSALLGQVRQLHELNPMLGHRGCRLGVTFPEVYEMQARAIFQAAVQLLREGHQPRPEVMIPLVGHREELRRMKELVQRVAAAVAEETGVTVPCIVGTMIEVPRAAVTADEIAQEAEFFSFGTNDLTQTTFGFSRDDAEGKFLHHYTAEKILPENPFAVLDESGVGKLIHLAAELGRGVNPALKLGICGEHGGEKNSIRFCHEQGLHYVSCSPFRVPLARLAAAQAAVAG